MWPIKRGGDKRHLVPVGWALTATLVVAGVTATGLVWLVWRLLDSPPLNRTQVSLSDFLDVVKIALAIVAGIGGVVALVVAYRRQRVAERADAREDEAHLRSDRAEERERTRLFNERFDMASEKLGSDKAAVRLAGVHAMANLADDWDNREARQMCIDVLCSYLRMPEQTGPPPTGIVLDNQDARAEALAESEETCGQAGESADREVRHTILRTIAAHLRHTGSAVTWQGHDFNLTGITLDIDLLDFNGAQFPSGRLVLANTRLRSGMVDFDNAVFSGGEVSFRGTMFSGGTVSFKHATFSGGDVCFGAPLSAGPFPASGTPVPRSPVPRSTSATLRSPAASSPSAGPRSPAARSCTRTQLVHRPQGSASYEVGPLGRWAPVPGHRPDD